MPIRAEDYPSYALGFTPGSASALALNTDMQQVFVNLIWSPFAQVRDGTFGSGWLDVGVEYVFTRRDLFGGAAQAGSAGSGLGVANRFLAAAVGTVLKVPVGSGRRWPEQRDGPSE